MPMAPGKACSDWLLTMGEQTDHGRLARRKADGQPVGRQQGTRDRKPRKRSGYVAAWEDGGRRRTAQGC